MSLDEIWSDVRAHLRLARGLLPESPHDDPGRGSLENFEHFLEHNELELALDEIQGIGERSSPPPEFWLALSNAAARMKLSERAAQLAKRAA